VPRFLSVSFVLALGACAAGFKVRDYPTPASLFAAGMAQYRQGNWGNAVTALDQVTALLPPRDTLLPRTYYFLAKAYEQQNHRLLAAASYKRIVDDFPGDTLADDAVLAMATDYEKVWRGPEFDKGYAVQALQNYVLLERLFPASPLAKSAQAGEARMNDGLARKDVMTGDFYVRRKAFDSALIYYKDASALYPGTPSARDALLKMVAVYNGLHYRADAADACRTLKAEYPAGMDMVKACSAVLADTVR
jgi:outer membrane protein assembly factor BamD